MTEDKFLDDPVKYYIIVKNGRRHFASQCLSAGTTDVYWIFPIPKSNAIGTLDGESNAIVSVTFGNYGDEPTCAIIAKDFTEWVLGPYDYRFCPNFTEDTIRILHNP